MILTSHSDMLRADSKTGVWNGEFTDPYYHFLDAGFEITVASPQGGEPPVDPMSKLTENITASNRRFQDDEEAQDKFENTITLGQLNSDEYAAVFFPGGHGPVFDLAEDAQCGRIILDFYKANKPISAVCHGSAAFLAAEKQSPGFLNDKMITCFSNVEEKMVMKDENVPFLLETALSEKGAVIENATIPFLSNVKTDGLLVTGQNPLSAGPTAKALLDLLERRDN